MNRGVLQSSPVHQMMAGGNPNWWNINTMRPPPTNHLQQAPSHFLIPTSHDNQELPYFSQLLLGGLMGEEEEEFQRQASNVNSVVDMKQENPASETSYVYSHNFHHLQANKQAWSHQVLMAAANSSPKSCVTSFSSNMLEFSSNNKAADARQPQPDRSSECISSTATGGALKKARVQPSATQSTFKVRKEKLGDRITTLHQLVSPFGKTDTASVLLEAIGYIRFLHGQIEALSLPYLGNESGNIRQQQPVQGEKICKFPEDPGQLLNENSMKRKGGPPDQQDFDEEPKKDLRSRGLCLVPVSCTLQVGGDNGADYWAPAFGGGFR